MLLCYDSKYAVAYYVGNVLCYPNTAAVNVVYRNISVILM